MVFLVLFSSMILLRILIYCAKLTEEFIFWPAAEDAKKAAYSFSMSLFKVCAMRDLSFFFFGNFRNGSKLISISVGTKTFC